MSFLEEGTKRRDMTFNARDRLSPGGIGKLFSHLKGSKNCTFTLNGLPGRSVLSSVRIESLVEPERGTAVVFIHDIARRIGQWPFSRRNHYRLPRPAVTALRSANAYRHRTRKIL